MAKRVVHVLGWVGALAILGLFVFGGLFDAWVHGLGFIMVTLATVAVLLHLIVSPDAPMSRAVSTPVLVGIGQVSYGIYLWQNTWIMYAPGDGLALAGAVVALTAVCALLSWVLVEQPALRLKRRFERRPDAPALGRPQAVLLYVIQVDTALAWSPCAACRHRDHGAHPGPGVDRCGAVQG